MLGAGVGKHGGGMRKFTMSSIARRSGVCGPVVAVHVTGHGGGERAHRATVSHPVFRR
jgi:hypothetical protein